MKTRLLIVAAALTVVLSGCAAVQAYLPFYRPGPDKIGMAIDQYCQRVSVGLRGSFRRAVNAEASPHRIEIFCYGDTQPTSDEEDTP